MGIAVANAASEVLNSADWKTERSGGFGAIRECAEHIIGINGGKSEK